eukprot:g1904.t1
MSHVPLYDSKPLHGIRILEFGTYIAGSLCARNLGDCGALVTHIVPPSTLSIRGIGDDIKFCLSRGKKQIKIDLKSKSGKKQVWDLIKNCDVLIENFSNGVMDRLGFSYSKVHQTNPSCIYLSLPGFASNDAEHQSIKAYEATILAEAGVFCDMGLNRTLMGINPSYSPLPLASGYSSVIGALGVTLALIRREKTRGLGDHIEVPLGAALCDALVFNSMDIPDLPPRYLTLRELEIATYRKNEEPMNFNYSQVKDLLDPFYHTYVCKDDRPFYVVAPSHEMHQERCLKALGIWDDMVAMGLLETRGDIYADSDKWGNNKNMVFGTYPLTDPIWIVRLKNAMAGAFRKRTASAWERIFGSMKITGCKTLTSKEWLNSEHALASGLVIERQRNGKTIRECGPVVWSLRSKLARTDYQREKSKQKLLNKMRAASPLPSSLWLSGVKVVDLCNVIAGPTMGGMLKRYGATVIKVDPTKPTYDALVAVFMAVPINQGKQSLLADIKTKGGKEILKRLVRWGDVVLTNQVSSQLRSLCVDEISLKKINPDIILTQFDAFGGPHVGPRSDFIGYDDLLQASTGIMTRFGGSLKTPAEHAHLGTVDVISGFSGCLATCMAIFKRMRTGECDFARTSLAANAQVIQISYMFDYDGRKPFDEPAGPHAVGEHSLYRWYKTPKVGLKNNVEAASGKYATRGQGHVFIAAPRLDTLVGTLCLKKLENLIGKSLLKITERGRINAIQKYISKTGLNADEVCTIFNKVGKELSCVPLNSMSRLRELSSSGAKIFGGENFINTQTFHFNKVDQHPIGGSVEKLSPCSIVSKNVPVSICNPAPKYGEHTVDIMANILHFSDAEINNLLKDGTIGTQWSDDYIPDGNSKKLNPWNNVKEEYNIMMKNIKNGKTKVNRKNRIRTAKL